MGLEPILLDENYFYKFGDFYNSIEITFLFSLMFEESDYTNFHSYNFKPIHNLENKSEGSTDFNLMFN